MYWLSESFLTLFEASRAPDKPQARTAHTKADIVIIGSGYGGSVAAEKLARHVRQQTRLFAGEAAPVPRVMVLERGKEFLPGEFPEDISELPSQVRINRAGRGVDPGYPDSLIQVFPADENSDSSVSVIVGSALGGGSQINAGVTRRPHPSVFDNPRWPQALRGKGSGQLHRHFDEVTRGLNAKPLPGEHRPHKLAALERLCEQMYQPGGLPDGYRAEFERPPIAVNYERFPQGRNPDGVMQPVCNNCGNCSSGCNTGAKNTLTTNYLPRARAAGAEIYTGALVARLRPLAGKAGHEIEVRPTSNIDAADHDYTLYIEARIVILAAGSLGSTEILLRSDDLRDQLSERLGECFSTNGDSISARYKSNEAVHALGKGLAAEGMNPATLPGPTITGAIILVPKHNGRGADGLPLPTFTVEDCAIPLPLAELGAELVTSAAMLRMMTQGPRKTRKSFAGDPLGTSPKAMDHTSFYLSMARDTASGKIVLSPASRPGGLPHASIEWPYNSPPDKEVPQSGRNLRQLDDILAHAVNLGGYYVPNPAREPVPPAIGSAMSNMPRGSSMTVHPLGGCPMGDDAEGGVVDYRGRVFDRKNGGVVPGLYVMDGAIIPCAVETNPFLTIGGLAHMAVELLIGQDLPLLLHDFAKSWVQEPGTKTPALAVPPRPLPAAPDLRRAAPVAIETRLRFRERLRQKLDSPEGLSDIFDMSAIVPADFEAGLIYLELALAYEPPHLDQFLASRDHECDLSGGLRLVRRRLSYPAFADSDWETCSDSLVIDKGKIQLFRPAIAPTHKKFLTTLGTWAARRGLRESKLEGKSWVKAFIDSANPPYYSFVSHLGASREVAYDFTTVSRSKQTLQWRGLKNISYRKDSNVWKDLFTLPLTVSSAGRPLWAGRLAVDVDYFLGAGVPSVVQQQSLPHAIVALLSYAMLYLRVILHTYFYEFGPPDYPEREAQPMPLPGPLKTTTGVISPQKYWLPVAEYADTQLGIIRKGRKQHPPGTRPRIYGRDFEEVLRELEVQSHEPKDKEFCLISAYRQPDGAPLSSVLLIHGYAISSSMWTSTRIAEDGGMNMVQSLLNAGHDVYVADLRTSSALTEIRDQAVSYDEVARADIPCAIEFVWQQHRMRVPGCRPKINLVAHCMGSAQTSMALLSQEQSRAEDGVWSRPKSSFMMSRQRIDKACFFQVAPLLAVTRANAVRGRAAAVFDVLVNRQTVSPWLKPGSQISTIEALLDRLAMTFPYPDGRDQGQPDAKASSPWTGITRKAFWLYGETWDNSNLGASTRQHIEEMIGPVNLGTYRQVGAFVRRGRVVNELGLNDYVKDRFLKKTYGSFDSLWLHGERSGMFEKQTTAGMVARIKTLLGDSARSHRVHFQSLPGFGHLDSLIGREAYKDNHRHVVNFLADATPPAAPAEKARKEAELAPYRAACADVHPARVLATKGAANHSGVHESIVGPACCGPFFSRTKDEVTRVWFFIDAPFGEVLRGGNIAVVRPDNGQWRFIEGWGFTQARSIAALKQFVAEIPTHLLHPGDRVVAASVMSNAAVISHRAMPDKGLPPPQTMNVEEIASLLAGLPALFEAGSFVEPVAQSDVRDPSVREFWVGSCHYPGWLIDKEWATRAHTAWLDRARTTRPEALVLLGDQIYMDAMGNFIGDAPKADMMADAYVEAFGGPTPKQSAWLQLLRHTSLHCMMDDHELTDNYSLSGGHSKDSMNMAFEAFALFQGPSLPHWKMNAGYKYCGFENGPGTRLSGAGELSGCPVFYLDCRYHRVRNTGQLFNPEEFAEFEAWASMVDKHRPKFIATGSVLVPVLAATLAQPAATLNDDSLNGYPDARNALLEVIAREGLHNVVFLSGDLHLSCFGQGHLETPQGALPFGFCVSSGLYSPLPFANSRTWHLPAPNQMHKLEINSLALKHLSFEIKGLTEGQALARIAVNSTPAGASVDYECIGKTGQPLLAGKLLD